MFSKGIIKRDKGIDITFKNNPDHVLSPDNYKKLIDFRFGKIKPVEFKKYYYELLKRRWNTRRSEFLELAEQGKNKDIKLLCHCGKKESNCHAYLAAEFMNLVIKKLNN